MSDPKEIYLGPACEADSGSYGDGRTWAEDQPWDDCECGHKPVRYVRADIHDALAARLAEREAQIKRWQDSSGCVGTFCKAGIMLDRNRELQAWLVEAERLLVEAEAAARLSHGAGWRDYARRAAAFLRPADSAEPAPEKCPNALLPDGPVCPRCGGRRGPSGVDGGSWVHY